MNKSEQQEAKASTAKSQEEILNSMQEQIQQLKSQIEILHAVRMTPPQRDFVGHGTRLAEPSSQDLAEFADLKLRTTGLGEIVKMSAEAQGLTEEIYMRQQAEAARRKENAES